MQARDFVSRLQKVKQHGEDRWTACCPAHDDRSPSLAVTATASGKILVKCWAGCSALDVLGAMGLRMSDLFPDTDYEPPMAFAQREMRQRQRKQSEASRAVTWMALAIARIARGEGLSDRDQARYLNGVRYIEDNGLRGELDKYLERMGGANA